MKFSVVVCNYNSSDEDIKFTLNSIIHQNFSDFEIVFADDGSKTDPSLLVRKIMDENSFNNFKICVAEKNTGTIKNLIRGVYTSRGKYIKPIGTGDAFANDEVLQKMFEFMELNKAKIAFTGMKIFSKRENDNYIYKNFTIPRDIRPWNSNDNRKAMENVIVYNDQISGASLFYEREYLLYLLEVLDPIVKYMEDLCQYIAMLEGEHIYYYKPMCVLYEYNNGISTDHSSSNMNKMKQDKQRFLHYIFDNYDNEFIDRRKKFEEANEENSNKIKKVIKKTLIEPKWLYFKYIKERS